MYPQPSRLSYCGPSGGIACWPHLYLAPILTLSLSLGTAAYLSLLAHRAKATQPATTPASFLHWPLHALTAASNSSGTSNSNTPTDSPGARISSRVSPLRPTTSTRQAAGGVAEDVASSVISRDASGSSQGTASGSMSDIRHSSYNGGRLKPTFSQGTVASAGTVASSHGVSSFWSLPPVSGEGGMGGVVAAAVAMGMQTARRAADAAASLRYTLSLPVAAPAPATAATNVAAPSPTNTNSPTTNPLATMPQWASLSEYLHPPSDTSDSTHGGYVPTHHTADHTAVVATQLSGVSPRGVISQYRALPSRASVPVQHATSAGSMQLLTLPPRQSVGSLGSSVDVMLTRRRAHDSAGSLEANPSVHARAAASLAGTAAERHAHDMVRPGTEKGFHSHAPGGVLKPSMSNTPQPSVVCLGDIQLVERLNCKTVLYGTGTVLTGHASVPLPLPPLLPQPTTVPAAMQWGVGGCDMDALRVLGTPPRRAPMQRTQPQPQQLQQAVAEALLTQGQGQSSVPVSSETLTTATTTDILPFHAHQQEGHPAELHQGSHFGLAQGHGQPTQHAQQGLVAMPSATPVPARPPWRMIWEQACAKGGVRGVLSALVWVITLSVVQAVFLLPAVLFCIACFVWQGLARLASSCGRKAPAAPAAAAAPQPTLSASDHAARDASCDPWLFDRCLAVRMEAAGFSHLLTLAPLHALPLGIILTVLLLKAPSFGAGSIPIHDVYAPCLGVCVATLGWWFAEVGSGSQGWNRAMRRYLALPDM